MEKITLKPAAKEFLYKSDEENVYFDILSCQGSTNQEKNLGSLFIISQVKYFTGDLSYMVSLISSLAKREFYSATSLQEQNPKEAFSRTLKKLNEILEEFFQNKDFKLNIGLVAITGENIFISRLGKFKINLARNNQFIDILNNVDLFNKDAAGEKQFSNIISGKLQQNDKLFAFFPTRSITSRERQLNDIFLKENQGGFQQKIVSLAANINNFSCCGVHIDMQQIKEIPFQPTPKYSIPIPPRMPSVTAQAKSGSPAKVATIQPTGAKVKEANEEEAEAEPSEPLPEEQPRIIPAELSVTKRGSIFTSVAAWLGKLRLLNRINNKTKFRIFISLAVIIIAIPVFLTFFRGNDQTNNAISLANENLKLAQSRLSQNSIKEARSLLQAALFNISDLSNKKVGSVKNEINQILADLDHVSDKQPVVFLNLGEQAKNSQVVLIAVSDDNVSVVGTEGDLFSITSNGVTKLENLKVTPEALFATQTAVTVFDGTGKLAVLDLKSKKINSYSLSNPVPSVDSVLYEDNLYTLSENNIYKYADAITGGVKRTDWGSDSASGRLIALATDGNIYALNDSGKLIKYFKGKKLGEFDLQVTPSDGSRIFAAKDSAFIYLADKANRKVYVFDKSNGELKTSYDLIAAGKIQDIFVSPNGTIWILSTDSKVWQVK